MSVSREFHYRLPRRVRGWRPGSHPGSGVGAGQEFVSHMSLYDWPEPRRLDLRASLQSTQREWLVRVNRQRASVPVYAIVDVSASMRFGSRKSRLHVAADFVEALSHSAFRVGDSLGMLAFDATERTDLFVPAHLSRGMGALMVAMLRECKGGAGGASGLEQAALHLGGPRGLVFIVSDFHWCLARLADALDVLAHAYVVPMILWDPAEIQPPSHDGLAVVRDAESGAMRTLWVRSRLRHEWREAVAARRAELNRIFAAREIRPFYVEGDFDGEALSQYFLEAAA
jgi:von Willebrand factor type A domain